MNTENKIIRINWSRGQYSDVFRSTVIDPSPLKQGQKVKVLWGKTKKEFTATVGVYPIDEPVKSQGDLPPRRARTKRKLVSILFYSSQTTDNLYLECNLPCSNLFDLRIIHTSKTHLLRQKRRRKKANKESKRPARKAPNKKRNQKERHVPIIVVIFLVLPLQSLEPKLKEFQYFMKS